MQPSCRHLASSGAGCLFILSSLLCSLKASLIGVSREVGRGSVRCRLSQRWQLGAVLTRSLIKSSWAMVHLWQARGGAVGWLEGGAKQINGRSMSSVEEAQQPWPIRRQTSAQSCTGHRYLILWGGLICWWRWGGVKCSEWNALCSWEGRCLKGGSLINHLRSRAQRAGKNT